MEQLDFELLKDRAKDRKTELNTFCFIAIVVAIMLAYNDYSLWWVWLIAMTLFATLDIAMRIVHYLDLCSCLLEEQNEILKEKNE